MKPLGQFDTAYRDRVLEACTAAIVDLSRDPVSNVAVLRNGEVVDALIEIVAMFLATSSEAASPRGTRAIVDRIAKRLRTQVTASRQHIDVHGTPFDTADLESCH